MRGFWCVARFTALLLSLSGSAQSNISEEEATDLVMRQLQQGDDVAVDYYEYQLSNFSVRFDRCQYVKMYDDSFAQDEESDSPLAIKHFAVYRLCPSDDCQSCDGGVFGRYVTELENYLTYTVAQQQAAFEYMCNNCQDNCNEDGGYCSGCGKLCDHLDNLEANGYIDAANYATCQKLELNYDDDGNNAADDGGENANDNAEEDGGERRLEEGNDDGNQFQLYIGPRCSSDGSRVLIGLFTDEYCLDPYTEADPEDFLEGKLSYHYMSHTSSNDGEYCLSCMESEEDANQADDADGDDVNEMCESLYDDSAKCESKYGLNGFVNENRQNSDYENQVENEFMVCSFIQSLLLNAYTETGDINLEGDSLVITRKTTHLQKVSLSMLVLILAGLFGAVYTLRKQIKRSIPKLDLACQSADAELT
jgi:hypothetical protein